MLQGIVKGGKLGTIKSGNEVQGLQRQRGPMDIWMGRARAATGMNEGDYTREDTNTNAIAQLNYV